MGNRPRRRGTGVATGLAALVVLAGCSGPAGSSGTASSTGGGPAGSSATPSVSTASPSPTASTPGVGASSASASPSAPVTGPAASSPASGGTPECRTADLGFALGPANGTAGTIYIPVQFTNTGTRACEIVGFPGVSYVSQNGTQVGAPAARQGAAGPAVVLQPGQTASSLVGMVDVGVFSASSCRPTPVAGLRIYPPDQTRAKVVAHPGTGCAGNPPDPQLRVRSVTAGSGTP